MPAAVCDPDDHSATIAAQRTNAIKQQILNVLSTPLSNLIYSKEDAPGAGNRTRLQLGEAQRLTRTVGRKDQRACRRSKNGPGPGTSPHRREGKKPPMGCPRLQRGFGMPLIKAQRLRSLSLPGTPPTPALGGAVMLLGTFGAICVHTLHPLPWACPPARF